LHKIERCITGSVGAILITKEGCCEIVSSGIAAEDFGDVRPSRHPLLSPVLPARRIDAADNGEEPIGFDIDRQLDEAGRMK
jgi:hypothetical protein